jgi:hypothetical protein
MNCFYLSPQNLLHNWLLYDVDTYTMGLDYVILAYLKVVHYFYGSVSLLNILAFLSFVFTRLVNYSIEYVLDVVFYIENNIWVRGNTRFISSVEHDIPRVSAANEWDIMLNTRNKSGISKHPCIFLFII